MVQHSPQQAQVGGALAMPTVQQQQQQPAQVQQANQQQQHYSPQADFYQQQLIKGAQQFVQQQQQHHHHQRLNGLHSGAFGQAELGPPQPLETLYNSARPAHIYAPKPTYYGGPAQAGRPVAFYAGQALPQAQPPQGSQQSSPASLSRLIQPALAGPLRPNGLSGGLSVRQLPPAAAPLQTSGALVGYPQPGYLQAGACPPLVQPQSMQEPLQAAGYFTPAAALQLDQCPPSADFRRTRPASDRDSVSTMSRLNQNDERRSFTMRSQFTSHHAPGRASRFGFLELSGEALRRLLGFGPHEAKQAEVELNQQRAQNLSLTRAHSNAKLQSLPLASSQQQARVTSIQNEHKLTLLDSGEDYHFKKKVLKYQLVILRLVGLLASLFVLLSPLIMLLIPKMDTWLYKSQQDNYLNTATTSTTTTTTNNNNELIGGDSISSINNGVITHAVGLSSINRHLSLASNQKGPPFYAPVQPQWKISECGSDCDGPLIGFFARFIMLVIAYWAIFLRSQTATLPRIDFHRSILISMAFLLTLAYWLFFIFRVFDKRFNDFELQYISIIQFSISMLESLILLHYLAIILLELRNKKKVYCLKLVRSPDGESRYYTCGTLSIQNCAKFILEKYHKDFKQYGQFEEYKLSLEDEMILELTSNNQTTSNNNDNNYDQTNDFISNHNNRRSRPSSPINSSNNHYHHHNHHNQTTGTSSNNRRSRHHSRANRHNQRSPSRSPTRSVRSRSQRKAHDSDNHHQVAKSYPVDLGPQAASSPQIAQQQNDDLNKTIQEKHENNNNNNNSNNNNNNDSNSGNDQSSDTASKPKESSLETVRAANSSSEFLVNGQSDKAKYPTSSKASSRRQEEEDNERNETESVRSVRSRRSTMSRAHHRHHHHNHSHNHRERSSSRANNDRLPSDNQASNGDLLGEQERKLRRRKWRLLAAVQSSFDQVSQFDEVNNNPQQHQLPIDSSTSINLPNLQSHPMGPNQAARSLYPRIAKPLQKYLRLTKQTGRHNLQSIYEHLSKCLLYKLSARTFLEKFVNSSSVWQQSETRLFANCKLDDSPILSSHQRSTDLEINSWSLVSDTLVSRQIDSGTFFLLKQGQISLLVSVAKLPHLNLSEEVIDQKSCKFILGSNSESSV